jgi:phenylpropionate dioxygenase-like ring-hydroxylating dioxygenase large terminal subunit
MSTSYPTDNTLTEAEKQYPLAPSLLDARHYWDPRQFELELERVFRRAWFPVCPSANVANPRDFVVWDRLGESVVIVRQDDGTITAWHNVCQHRGAKLVSGSGTCKSGRFKCPWHGFVYDVKGAVKSVPMRELFDPSELEGLRTPSARVVEWAGFVWLTLSDDLPDLREYLGEIFNELAWYGIERFEPKYHTEITLKANWKVVVDGFNETWHVPFTHSDTLAGMMLWRDAAMRIIPPHSWMTLPVRGFTDAPTAGADHRETHLCHYTLFPNTIFSCFPTHLQMWSVWPVSVSETVLSAWGVVGPTPEQLTEEKWAKRNDRDWEHFMAVIAEDAEVINDAGTIVRSAGFRRNMFNAAECRLTAFHDEVNRRIAD